MMKYRIRHVCEYVLLRAVAGFVRILPYRGAILTGWLVAFLGHYVFRFRASEARRRIGEAFPGRFSEEDVSRVAWISWRNFVLSLVDMFRLTLLTTKWMESHVVNCRETESAFRAIARDGKGVIFASPHMGSWELGGVVARLSGVPLFVFAARQKNPLVDAYANHMRSAVGMAVVQRGSSVLKQVIRRLKNGEALGFLPDVRMAADGVRVKFLGKEANVGGGMGLFARQSNVAIIPTIATRVGLTRHSIVMLKPVQPDPAIDKREDWQRMTQEVLSAVEQAIRSQPEQWFWYNKRWILDPVAPAPAPAQADAAH